MPWSSRVVLFLGVVPEFLIAKVPAMLGCESGACSPSDTVEEGSTPSHVKRSRRSLGGKSSMCERTVVLFLLTPLFECKLLVMSLQYGIQWNGNFFFFFLKQSILVLGLYRWVILSCIPDMVNGALTRLKSNRTPSNTPQPDGSGGYGKHSAWAACVCWMHEDYLTSAAKLQ